MADLFLNTTDQAELFNEYLAPGIVSQWRTISKMFDMCKKSWDHFDTEGLFWSQRIGISGSQSFGARSNAKYPESQQAVTKRVKVYAKRAEMFSLGFDGMALESARGKGAAVKPEDFEKEEQWKEIGDDISRQLIGDGSGRIAQCKGGDTAATTMYIDSPYFKKVAQRFLKPGRVIDVYLANHTSRELDSIKITAIDYDLDKLTIGESTWTDDSWVLSEDAVTAVEGGGLGESMGLLGIISRADPPIPNNALGLQGLTVGATPEWKAQIFDNPLGTGGTPRDITEDLFIQVLQRVERFAPCDVILVSPGVYRAWGMVLKAYVVLQNTTELWGGWSGLPFVYNGRKIPVVSDEFIPDGYALFLSMKNLMLHVLTPGMVTWEQGVSGILQKVADYNRYKAEGHFFGNLGTSLRPAFGMLKDISEPS